jgi:hypothetical protein
MKSATLDESKLVQQKPRFLFRCEEKLKIKSVKSAFRVIQFWVEMQSKDTEKPANILRRH